MPAKTGSQILFCFKFKNRLDSGFRGIDRNKSRPPVDNCRAARFGARGVHPLGSA